MDMHATGRVGYRIPLRKSSNRHGRENPCAPSLLSLTGSLGFATLVGTVLLNSSPVRAAETTRASPDASARVYHLDIPAQALSSALVALSNVTGVQLFYSSQLSQGLRSTAISGDMSLSTALERILAGTGLAYRLTGPNSVTLGKASSSTITLGPVRVGGMVVHQNPAGPGVGYVAENTVVGTKTDTPLREIPNSIYVITKQQMIDQQPQNLMEALRYTPGINAETMGGYQSGAANSNNIMQRGFGTSQFVDGIRSYSYSAGETAFLERVEALNGPASVMYGQTTPGGMIDMSLKKPTDTPLHEVTLGFGNWGRYEATLDLSDKVTRSGNVRYRVAAIGVTQGTQTNNLDYNRVGVLPSLTWDIDRKTSLTLLGSYLYTPGNGLNNTQLPPSVLLDNPNGRIPRSRFFGDPNWNVDGNRDAMFEYMFQHKFSDAINFSQTFRWEQSSSWTRSMNTGGGMISPTLLERMPMQTHSESTTIGLDSRVGGKFNLGPVRNTWIVGSDFRQYEYSTSNYIDWTPGHNGYSGEDGYSVVDIYNPQSNYVPCIDIRSSACMVTHPHGTYQYFQEGVYFQDQIKYKRLSVTLGGRQDWINYHGHGGLASNRNASHSITDTDNSQVPRPQNAFTWRAGIVYNFDFGLSPYFSYSTSFVPQSGSDWNAKPFPPLTGSQMEAGLKYETADHNVMVTAAAYRINEDHYLVNDPVHTNYSADGGRVRSEGFEVSAHANITRDLRFMASYSYISATYAKTNLSDEQDFPDGTAGAVISERGKYIQSVPRNLANAFLDYTPPVRVLKGFGFNGGVRYVGFTYADAVNSFKVPSYVLFDIGAHYDFAQAAPFLKGLRGQLAVSNLTNKYYVTSCGGTYSCYLGQGRRVYGNLSYRW
ncbi:MAG: TonB-dependent siderophore receptor [Gluconacetobacter liquefaciens]